MTEAACLAVMDDIEDMSIGLLYNPEMLAHLYELHRIRDMATYREIESDWCYLEPYTSNLTETELRLIREMQI